MRSRLVSCLLILSLLCGSLFSPWSTPSAQAASSPTPPTGWVFATTFQKVPLTLNSVTYYAYELKNSTASTAGCWLITKTDGTIVSDPATYKELALTATVSKMVQDSTFLPQMKNELEVLKGIRWRIELYETETLLAKLTTSIAAMLAGNSTGASGVLETAVTALVPAGAKITEQNKIHDALWSLFTGGVVNSLTPSLTKGLEIVGKLTTSDSEKWLKISGVVSTVLRKVIAQFAQGGAVTYQEAFTLANTPRSSWSYEDASLFLKEYEEGRTHGLPFAKWYISLIPHEGGLVGSVKNVGTMWWENIIEQVAGPEATGAMTAIDAATFSKNIVQECLKNTLFTNDITADIQSADAIFAIYRLTYDPSIVGSLAEQAITAVAPVATTQTTLSVTEIAKKVESVVYIEVAFGDGKGASGSGFIISPDGRIVTNYHVIDGAASGKVVLNDSTTFTDIRVLGWDKDGDLAIIKVDGSGLPAVGMGNSDAAQIGEAVVAIGSPLGFQNTVSTGIISARREGYLQTTAPISHGSSGGALFNMMGEVVGITSAGMEEGANLGFAIPINDVKSLVTDHTLTLAQFTAQTSGSVTPSVSVPSLIQPAATTDVDTLTPTFQWTKVATATRYMFWLGKGTTGTEDSKIYSEVVTINSLAVPAGILTDGGTYTWAVAAGNDTGWGDWSQDSVFSVKAAGTLGVPEVLEPDQEVTVPTLTPTFYWRAVTGATRYTFWLGKGTSGSQDSNILNVAVTGTWYTIPAGTLESGSAYTWNVSAGDASDWGDWGEDQHFTVDVSTGLRVPALLTPLPYATGVSRTATFTWAPVSGATQYDFWLGKGTSGSQDSNILNVSVTGTSYTVPAGKLDAGAVYTWNVAAGTATVWSDWTMDRYFKTAP